MKSSLFLPKSYPFLFTVIQWLIKACRVAGTVPRVSTDLTLNFYNKPTRRILLESHLREEETKAQS